MSNPNQISKRYDAVATVGKYKDRTTGEEKSEYLNVGTLLLYEDGRMSMKMKALPVVPEWSGWLAFYEAKTQDRSQTPPAASQRRETPPPSAANTQPDDDEDIPF